MTCSDEVWKPVLGFEGVYEVSNKGLVRSLRKRGGMVSIRRLPAGYLVVTLSHPGVRKGYTRLIHRLVAEAFCARSDPTLSVNHIDGDKANNTPDNLEWVSMRANIHHAIQTGLNKQYGATHSQAKMTEDQVREVRRLLSEGHMSQQAIATQVGCHFATVSLIKLGKIWRSLKT